MLRERQELKRGSSLSQLLQYRKINTDQKATYLSRYVG